MFAVVLTGIGVASADYTTGRSFDYVNKTTYEDRDWNLMFYENCARSCDLYVDGRKVVDNKIIRRKTHAESRI